MIKIKNQSDLSKLDNKKINPLIAAYIKKYFLFVCKQFKSSDLSQVGAFFILENQEDCLRHKDFGLSVPLEQSVFEFADLLTLHSGKEEVKLWHCLFVLTNNNATSLFVPADLLLLTNLESWLQKDYTERTVIIDNV